MKTNIINKNLQMKYPVGKIQTLMKIEGIFHMAIKKNIYR